MKTFLLILAIILLLIYAFILIDSIILLKKNGKKGLFKIRDILIKRVNACIILTAVLGLIIILRIVVYR